MRATHKSPWGSSGPYWGPPSSPNSMKRPAASSVGR